MKQILKKCVQATRKAWAAALWLSPSLAGAQAHLAITEIITSASTNHGPDWVMQGPDFFEVTNFGTEATNLNGWSWRDRGGTLSSDPFANLEIQPGESVLFFQLSTDVGSIATPEEFQDWWGLPRTVQARPWGLRPGLGSAEEWVEIFDAETNLVDSVYVGPAQRGVTFDYDTNTGVFGTLSVLGRGCAFQEAFRAITADDIGSPGCAAGPVPPHVFEQPQNLDVDACQEASFSVRVGALPRAGYQWWFRDANTNEAPLAGATSNTLTITNVQVTNDGQYWVEIRNVAGVLTSEVATLTVNTNPHPPTVERGPRDASIYPGQCATFDVLARGYPCLSYQWRSNDVILPGATGRRLTVCGTGLAPTGIVYSVEVRNDLGGTNASAVLRVTPKPKLRFTEVMPWASINGIIDHQDWFELTNYDTNAVSLLGWKLSDSPAALSAGVPVTITQAVTLLPGRSAIFVERMTPGSFIAWWGATNLPPGLPIIPYAGFGLSQWGEVLTLWNPAATEPDDFVARVSFWAALQGVSMYWYPTNSNADMVAEPQDSVAGSNCAFPAVDGDDVGSPGFALGLAPRFLGITCDAEGATLTWQANGQSDYCVQFTPDLKNSPWANIGAYHATGGLLTARHPNTDNWGQGFYRLKEGPCP